MEIPITFIGNFDRRRNSQNILEKTIKLNLNISGKQIIFKINVLPDTIRLSDIVPLAQELSTIISNIVLKKLGEQGKHIPCRKGCSACCSYLVPLSIPEAFRLREEIISMDDHYKKQILNLSLAGAKRILEEKPAELNLLEIEQLSNWYSNLNLTCPFLSNNICSSYEIRPIACREYLITGSASSCNPGYKGNFNKVDLPVSILECLGKLSAELEQTNIEAIMLPLALPWAQENLGRNINTWPALETIKKFVEIMEQSSIQYAANTDASQNH